MFVLFYIFANENESYIVRLKSRASFVTRRIADSAVFAFLFSFLIEAVSVVAALICFDINLILELNFLQYSALELLTLFLFYFRAGLVMLSFGIIISPKVAPFITIALYLIELFATIIFMISKVWLPFRDSVVVPKLMHGEMVLSDMWGIILRALLMMFMLIFSSYFLYQKKDVLSNVKSKLVLSIILIVACLAQLFSCVFQGNFQNAFMIGLAPSDYGFEITKFLLLLLPLCFILFFTSGSIENLKQGYGKMLIVRNYSKTVLILKRCLNNFIALICIVLFQFIIFLLQEKV